MQGPTYSWREKEGKEKSQFGTKQKHCTISHDCLTTAMFSSARTWYFLPRKQVWNNDRSRPRTFCCFRSYQKAQPGLKANLSRTQKGQELAQGGLRSKPWRLTEARAVSNVSVCVCVCEKGTKARMQGKAEDSPWELRQNTNSKSTVKRWQSKVIPNISSRTELGSMRK